MRRVLAGFFALLIVVLAAPTASAQDSVSVTIGGVSDGQTIRGTQNVSASASAGTGVDSLVLIIAGYTASSTEPSGVQNSANVSYPWDTRHFPNSGSWTRNGSYAITARARSNGGNVREVTINVNVDNDATAPTGLSGSGNNQGVVKLSWNRNPEPDVSAYKIERDGAAIGETQDTSYTDQVSPGNYSYRIVALRGNYATPSGTVSVTVEAPPPPEPEESPYEEPNPSDEPYYEDHPQPAGGGDYQQDPNGYGQFPSGGDEAPCYDCDTGCFSCGYDGGGGSDADSRLFGSVDDFKAKGLPGAIFAPGWGSAGLPALPGVPRPPATYPLEWGTYEENLPYDLSAGQEMLIPGDRTGLISRTIRTIIPPDGLRWVAVGILMIVSAGMMRTIGARVAPPTKLS
ncbi:MAG TPA: hypothetical protein VHJ82_00675 [Actinomycetota bacterium]|nr:hypothetical protein [Actinomycetota bacterium]